MYKKQPDVFDGMQSELLKTNNEEEQEQEEEGGCFCQIEASS